ncbi:Chemotaxis protein CheY [Clostridium liquoris]|jgi:DNA-binding response OmpR family regulator|uniref:Stage 0 sporulation protein A homolog n=1 Tax=Clostridium liquoris TaxID=1289519 RepID=A0A2T0B5N9_9CLOT|nr:response regulator [Clostridium liquoris]PRR79199.1 Chemotaxis protein CheY [Clostridium liquoris]
MGKVIILENLAYSRYRLKELLIENDIEVIEAYNSFDFFNRLYENRNSIDLIILELNLYGEDGLQVMRKVKERNIDIPIMVVTSENKRKSFVESVRSGAADYILKPYDNNMLVDRITKCIKNGGKWGGGEETILIDFRDYLEEEIKKAKEESYEISILIMSFTKSKEEEKVRVNEEYLILNDLFYRNMEKLFNKPELFTKLGFTTFIAILPRYSKGKGKVIKEKVNKTYEELKLGDIRLKDYYVEQALVAYPEDGDKGEELISKGEELLKEILKEKQFNTV